MKTSTTVELVHLLHQWTYIQVSVSIYEQLNVYKPWSRSCRLAPPGSASHCKPGAPPAQWTYADMSVSIYDIKSSTSEVLLGVDSHHLAQPVIVDLVHLLHQWTYTQMSLSIFEHKIIHEPFFSA